MYIHGQGKKLIQHRNYGDVVVELVIDFEAEGMHNPYPESGDCEIVYQGIPSWAFKKNLSNMDEAMTLYSPTGASTRGGACRNRPTESEYIAFFQLRLKRGNMEPKKFLIGGMWEEPEWEIRFDEEVSNLERVCSHCYGEHTDTHPTAYGGTYTTHVFKCKRVVVATNEGGCNTTGVCLDCILDAAKTLDEARKL